MQGSELGWGRTSAYFEGKSENPEEKERKGATSIALNDPQKKPNAWGERLKEMRSRSCTNERGTTSLYCPKRGVKKSKKMDKRRRRTSTTLGREKRTILP